MMAGWRAGSRGTARWMFRLAKQKYRNRLAATAPSLSHATALDRMAAHWRRVAGSYINGCTRSHAAIVCPLFRGRRCVCGIGCGILLQTNWARQTETAAMIFGGMQRSGAGGPGNVAGPRVRCSFKRYMISAHSRIFSSFATRVVLMILISDIRVCRWSGAAG